MKTIQKIGFLLGLSLLVASCQNSSEQSQPQEEREMTSYEKFMAKKASTEETAATKPKENIPKEPREKNTDNKTSTCLCIVF